MGFLILGRRLYIEELNNVFVDEFLLYTISIFYECDSIEEFKEYVERKMKNV